MQIIKIIQDLDKLGDQVESINNQINSKISFLLSDSIPMIEEELRDRFGSGIDDVDINLNYSDGEFVLSFDNINQHKIFNHNSQNYTLDDVTECLQDYISNLIDQEFSGDW